MTSGIPEAELLPCPFCGGKANYERMGTTKQSCIIECSDCGCSLETGEVWNCGQAWNARHYAQVATPAERVPERDK